MPAIDISATTRTAAVPPVARRELAAVDPARAQAAARAARRETPTVTGLPMVPALPPAARPPLRGLTPTRPPVDDNETDLVAALPDVGAESDPTIEPPPPGPARPVSDPAALAKARSAMPQTLPPPMAPHAAIST